MDAADSAPSQNKGRPSYAPTEADRAHATTLAASGMPDEAIAESLNVSVPTLRKHLSVEIAAGRAQTQPALFPAALSPEGATPSTAAAPPLKRPGRKRYAPSRDHRERVKLLAAAGIRHSIIAARLGISEPTFRRAFADDLETAREEKRAETVELLHREARGGSVPAIKELRAIFDETDLSLLRPVAQVEKRPEKETLGKKVQAAKAAETAGTKGKWAQLASSKPILQ